LRKAERWAKIGLCNPALAGSQQRAALCFATRAGLGKGRKFFYFFSRNPLKSPDSAKEKQGNPSLFAWFHLDFLAFPWDEFVR
jgi:hypothetical protein